MINQYYKDFRIRDYMDENDLGKLPKDLIDCSLGTNPFIDDKVVKSCVETAGFELNKYSGTQYELLKDELISFYKEYLFETVDRNNIAFGSGAMGTIRNLCEFLISENTKVLGIAPQFPRFISEIELKKGIYQAYYLDKKNNYKFIVDDFIKLIDNSYSVISIENPNNPTGQIIDIADIEKIVKEAKKYNIIVLVDEAYGDYMPNSNSAIGLVGKYDNIITIRSASKFFGLPNHRVGYLFADKEIVKVYNEIAVPFAFSDLSASAFIQTLKQSDKFEYTKQKTIEAKQNICKALKKENYLHTSIEAPILTIKSDKYKDLNESLLKAGILAENCKCFMNLDSSFARIRINSDYERLIQILLKVL